MRARGYCPHPCTMDHWALWCTTRCLDQVVNLNEANPQVYVETPLHPEKLTVWCALWAGGIIGPYFFKNDEGHNVTVNGDRYRAMITNFFIPELNNHDVQELWFQQDGATCHTARAAIDLLKDTFGDRLISRFGPVNWPPRSCDLTPLDYFLWGYVNSLVYVDKPQTLDHLEDNIRRVIADIRPQMLEKVIGNWTSRLDYIRASRGSPMPEIIFKICELQGVKNGSQQRENTVLFTVFFDKGENASQVAEIANDIYGANTVTANYLQFWFRRFRSGIFDVKDAPRTGRPVVRYVDKITEIVKIDRSLLSTTGLFEASDLPELANKLGVVFHQDNARPHTSVATRQNPWKLDWDILMHPPYRPDLEPSDFHLVLAMQNFLSDKKLGSREDSENRLLDVFTNKAKTSMSVAFKRYH
ncbi:transposable element Tc3 transposase [Trichonephila clavipes]|uniref:Transposable element Tc3 transposase n=1 Tax=Trichonephila clavipes TaxID=2585209 RepID=A0A8X6UXM0_TRICX|nr:transposable element Tc3 transposase [Trichonephila clavipes]